MTTFNLRNLVLKNWILVLMNKFITTLFFIAFFFCSSVSAEPMVNVRTAIVVDYHSDKVLYEYEADIQLYPASILRL